MPNLKDKDKFNTCRKEEGSAEPKLIFFEFRHFVFTWYLNERLKINGFLLLFLFQHNIRAPN